MARGYDGAFGRKVNAPYVWIPLLIAFLVPFIDPRRPFRWLHLDVLVLAGVQRVATRSSTRARSTRRCRSPFPLLAYLLARMLAIGLRRRREGWTPPPLIVPASWLAIGIVFLVGFRVGLNVTDSNVIDVGYAGVIGADRIADGDPLYGNWPKDNEHGDTYGPVTYAAYLPFEQLFPWTGEWNDLPAAHGAAIVFDLLALAGVFLLGRRIGGTGARHHRRVRVGGVPVHALRAEHERERQPRDAAHRRRAARREQPGRARGGDRPRRAGEVRARGARAGAGDVRAGRAGRGASRRAGWRCSPPSSRAVAGAILWLAVDDLGLMWERTVAFQADRDAPFSIWGLYELDLAQSIARGAAVILALALAVVPRRQDLAGLAALCAAVLIASQLSTTYWFYLYLVWFFPLVMLAVLAPRPPWRPSTA